MNGSLDMEGTSGIPVTGTEEEEKFQELASLPG